MAPNTQRRWVIAGKGDFDALKLEDGDVPEVGDTDVLVKCAYQKEVDDSGPRS